MRWRLKQFRLNRKQKIKMLSVCSGVQNPDAVRRYSKWKKVFGLKNLKAPNAVSAAGKWSSFSLITTRSKWGSWSSVFGARDAQKNLTEESHLSANTVITAKVICTSFFTSSLGFRISQPFLKQITRKPRLNRNTQLFNVLPFAWYSLSDCTNPLTTIPLLRSVRYRGQVEAREGNFVVCDALLPNCPEIYFPSRNFDKPVTPPLFLPNTMKIKILIIHPALKLGVKLGLEAISSTPESECER